MHMKSISLLLFTLLFCENLSPTLAQYGYGYNPNAANHESVLLESIKVLTFTNNKYTTGRRSAPIPQLTCTGNLCREYAPTTIQCKNVGSDGTDVQWECKADLDSSVRFGHTEVSCEGYNYPEDPYVLKGSCGLEYNLESTEQGRNKGYGGNHGHSFSYDTHGTSSSSWGNVIMYLIIGAIIVGMVHSCSQNPNRGYANPIPPGSPYGGGGPGGYPGGPNSPYGSPPPYNPGCAPSSSPIPPNTGGGPGFWTGLGTGGLLGYLFRPRAPSYYGGGMRMGSPYRSYNTYSSPSAPSFSSSSSPRSASGFASTRRR